MEAYFNNDPRIREWVNQITEKIFTVCLLTGADSDAEFQSGCQIVMKLIALFQDIPTIPSEFLADGVKQLLEQQLPDTRVIANFPAFQATMERMLREGILKTIENQNTVVFKSVTSTERYTEQINTELYDNNIGRHVEELCEEFMSERVIPAIAVNSPHLDIQKGEDQRESTDVVMKEIEYVVEVGSESESIEEGPRLTQTTDGIEADTMDPLQRVLKHLFPNGTVFWNKMLMGKIFLAQVEDILICLDDPKHPCGQKTYNEEGWKVLVCCLEDLAYPRRLERGIRQIQRSGKMFHIV
ncbi:MAG TPA: hypothetical protein VIM51_03355 [Desulfosporosinus sp.]